MTGKCYRTTDNKSLTREDALRECQKSDSTANFATILDEPTNSFVQSIIDYAYDDYVYVDYYDYYDKELYTMTWIGLEKVNGEWVWPDGTKAIYTNWFPQQPSGNGPFTEIDIWSGKWNDISSSYERDALCQYDPYARGRYTMRVLE